MSQNISEIALIIILGTALMLVLTAFIVFMVALHRHRQLRHHQQLTEMEAAFEKTILLSQVEAQEETFRYIGRELHDNLGHSLSVAKLYLAEPSAERIKECTNTLNEVIRDVRAMSQNLHTRRLEETSFQDLVEQEVARIAHSAGIFTTCQLEAPFHLTASQHKVVVFRIFQECCQNILKHARASKITVRLVSPNILEIIDDGVGFDTKKATTGAGLTNMRLRATTIGASIRWESSSENGTKVVIQLKS